MKPIRMKDILLALIPLIVLSIGVCIYDSVRKGQVDTFGFIYTVYLIIPVILFTLVYVGLLSLSARFNLNFLSSTFIGNLIVSVALVAILFTFWVIFDGSPYKYRGMDFWSYWFKEMKRMFWALAYLALTIPLVLYLSRR